MEMCLVVPFKYCLSYHVTNVPSYVRSNCMRVLVEAASQKTLKFTLTYMVMQKLKFSDFPKIDKIYETTFRVCLDSSQRNSRFAGVKKQAQIQRAPVLSPSPFGPKF